MDDGRGARSLPTPCSEHFIEVGEHGAGEEVKDIKASLDRRIDSSRAGEPSQGPTWTKAQAFPAWRFTSA